MSKSLAFLIFFHNVMYSNTFPDVVARVHVIVRPRKSCIEKMCESVHIYAKVIMEIKCPVFLTYNVVPTRSGNESTITDKHWIWFNRFMCLSHNSKPVIQGSTFSIFTARCTLVQSAVLRSHVVCPSVRPSVTLVNCDHIGWKSS